VPARTVFGTGIVMFVDETTSGSRSDGWGLEIAEEWVAVRELLRRLVFQEVAEYCARTPPSSRAWSSPTTANAYWRDWLERHGVTQPCKQAHREVYLLTDAECTTGTYSNRFAAHVPRQHQFTPWRRREAGATNFVRPSTTRPRRPSATSRAGACAPSTACGCATERSRWTPCRSRGSRPWSSLKSCAT
jgi:hypothetical protein